MAQELYILLGKENNVFFFLHTISEPTRFKESISFQIMNCAIAEGLVTNINEACVVFDIYPSSGITEAIVINHYSGEKFVCDKKILERQIISLLSDHSSSDTKVYAYDYSIGAYLFFNVKSPIPDFEIEKMEVKLNDITYIQTTKEIK